MYRRNFLAALGAGFMASHPAVSLARRSGGRAKFARPLGLQLFTVLKLLEADFEGTLALVSRLGYREVETLGSFGRDPGMVRDLLAKYNLVSPSQHMMPGDLYGHFQHPPKTPQERAAMSEQFDRAFAPEAVDTFVSEAITRALALGQRYVVWQLAWRPAYTLKDAERYALAFNRAGHMCREAGLGFAYHNHDAEFAWLGKQRPFDILVGETDPALVKLEIDFMWAAKGGADIAQLLAAHPGRFRLCHLKDHDTAGNIVTIGEGVENFHSLVSLARKAGIQHYYLEFDRPADPAREVRIAADRLIPLLKS